MKPEQSQDPAAEARVILKDLEKSIYAECGDRGRRTDPDESLYLLLLLLSPEYRLADLLFQELSFTQKAILVSMIRLAKTRAKAEHRFNQEIRQHVFKVSA